jgi:hypothetical protein
MDSKYSIAAIGAVTLMICQLMKMSMLKTGVITVCVLLTALVWIIGVTIIRAYDSDGVNEKIAYFGGLTPGNGPMLPLPPNVSANTLQLLLGDNLRILSASENPVLNRNKKTFLSIKVSNGLLRLTATILDASNQPICRIIDNEFQAFPERAFNPKQPDEHSLVVRDAAGNEVLNLRFINPRTIWLTGRFQLLGSGDPVLVLPNKMVFGDFSISGMTLNMTQNPGPVFEL